MNKLAFTVVFLVMSTPGCKDAPSIAEDQFCKEKANSECEGIGERCALEPSACVAERITRCEAFSQEAKQSSTARKYDPSQAYECVERTRSLFRSEKISSGDLDAVNE